MLSGEELVGIVLVHSVNDSFSQILGCPPPVGLLSAVMLYTLLNIVEACIDIDPGVELIESHGAHIECQGLATWSRFIQAVEMDAKFFRKG